MRTSEEIILELEKRRERWESYARKSWAKGFDSYDEYRGIAQELTDILEWVEND